MDYDQSQALELDQTRAQQEYYEANTPTYSGFGAKDDSLIKWQLQIDAFIKRKQLQMLGYRRNPLIKKWEKKAEPSATEEGISRILEYIESLLYKTITLSNLEQEDVYRMARDARRGFIELLFLNRHNWKLNKNDATIMVIEVDQAIFSNLRRAYKEGERRYHGRVHRISEHLMLGQKPKRSAVGDVWT